MKSLLQDYSLVDAGARGRAFAGRAQSRSLIATIVCFAFCLASSARAIEVLDLGPILYIGAPYQQLAINNQGQIAGVFQTKFGGPLQPFIWQNGVVTDLPSLPDATNMIVTGINEAGEVVGASFNSNSPVAVQWQNGKIMQLLNEDGNANSMAFGINDSGQIVGGAGNGSFTSLHPVIWQNDEVSNISTVVGPMAFGTNNTGQVVGGFFNFAVQNTTNLAFLWQNGVLTDLGAQYAMVSATAINDLGQIVGYGKDVASGKMHPILLQNGSVTDLGFRGYPTAINNRGQVIGVLDDNGAGPFLWQNGQLTFLNSLLPADSPWVIGAVWGINDHNQIVGAAQNLQTLHVQAVMITIPEPSGLVLAAIALLGLSAVALRRIRG